MSDPLLLEALGLIQARRVAWFTRVDRGKHYPVQEAGYYVTGKRSGLQTEFQQCVDQGFARINEHQCLILLVRGRQFMEANNE